ncbi:MAG: FAD-dependent monooxygenase, partial [Pseudomonadota bacterium]
MANDVRNIAIAGAGLGGLAAAALLARLGHNVRVFDRFDAPAPVGSGLMLQRTGLAVLDSMGLGADIRGLGQVIERLYGRVQPSGRVVLDVRFDALKSEPFALGVQRAAVFDTLLKAALAAGAQLETGVTIGGCAHREGVLLGSGGKTLGSFDLVVDALGARSPLSRDPKYELPYGALWATLPWPADGPFNANALEQRYLTAHQMAGIMPSGGASLGAPPMATYFWSLKASRERDWRTRDLDVWRQKAIALWPETAPLVDQILSHAQMTFARYRHRTASTPTQGRLVHLGDSWHAASPQLGQGANMAMLDAYALAQSVKSTGDLSAALGRYK